MSEILAPAGGKNSALAAINAGADAIYLGLSEFSARSSAENFALEEFSEICKTARLFGVKVYAALNTVVKQSEAEYFLRYITAAWNGGADAIIMQDLYLGAYIKSVAPEITLHLSTQAGTCNASGARLAKELGFSRVILARETKLKDIEEIAKIIETEVFVQGALCTCFSGQCYMSSFAGGNSGNRGRCKQPCRKLYSIDRDGFGERAYRLSLSDLRVGENIDKLTDAGVYSFKIEGRMRRPEYVSAAVTYYRNLLDGRSGDRDLSNLKRTFNRGNYTSGLAFGQDKSFISSAVQGHIGEFVGVVKVENGRYVCNSSSRFNAGDGFKILRDGKEVGGGAYGGAVKGGFIISSRDRLKNGDKAFITTDTALNGELLSKKRKIRVTVEVAFKAGERAEVRLNGIPFISDFACEKALTSPLGAEDIKNCFSKVDTYPFELLFGSVIAENAFLPASRLNAFRRDAYARFADILTGEREQINPKFEIPRTEARRNRKVAVICENLNGVTADIGILKPRDYNGAGGLARGFSGEKFLYVPPFLTGGEEEIISRAAEEFDGIYCDSFFGSYLAEKLGKSFFAGTGHNVTNSVALNGLKARYICLSKELTVGEADGLSRENTFYLTAGNIKVMDLIYCPFGKKCATCDKRDRYTLTDENGRAFPLRRYAITDCRFEVYNCADLVCGGGLSGKLIDCTLSDAREVTNCLTKGEDLRKIFENYTRGHSDSRIL